jgi:type II secretory pathway pseudopilin PulG
MTKTNLYNEGFTLTELLVNIIIISSLTFSMMLVFYQIQIDFDLEQNRTEVTNYANRVLDEISSDLISSYKVNNRPIGNTTSLQLYYLNTNEVTRIWVNSNYGFYKNNHPMYNYYPKDEQDRTKFNISKFDLDEPTFQAGDIFSSTANMARDSSYELNLEIDLFDRSNKKIETLKFNRLVFSANKYLHNINS